MNLADPELELIDPTPNVHTLFIHFDKVFFWAKLASRAVVRWSKRMYSCAGICSYEGRAGLCDIALSEPLLKLRPRKDLVETLLHEMIHAYLFIMCQDRERDGHGPNFQAHMHRINKSAGLNISIYHSFHDEVMLYQTHWWRCNGPCQKRKPYFGIVRKSQNRAPGPKDFWWTTHQQTCGGKFLKIKEPENKTKKSAVEKPKKNNGDITKYINNNNNHTIDNNTNIGVRKPLTPLLKNTGNIGGKIKSNGGNTLVITKKHDTPTKINTPIKIFGGKGQIVAGDRKKSSSIDVTEAVRNVWANKQLPALNNKSNAPSILEKVIKPVKHKADPIHLNSPPLKVKKIDEYFKSTATSILKDLYGQDIKLTEADNKIIAVTNRNLVDCPVCRIKLDISVINRHLDECLNKEVIEKLNKDNIDPMVQESSSKSALTSQSSERKILKEMVGILQPIPEFKKTEKSYDNKMFTEDNGKIKLTGINVTVDLTNVDVNYTSNTSNFPSFQASLGKEETISGSNMFNTNDVNRVKAIVKRITYDKVIRKSDNFIVPKMETDRVDTGFLPSFLDDMATVIKAPIVKIEPGSSKDIFSVLSEQKCPCCGNVINKPVAEHLDECLAFFDKNTTIPVEGASTSFANNTIVIDDDDDDDDVFDETMTINATGTKTPCPCCMEMIEMSDMNSHLDNCLS